MSSLSLQLDKNYLSSFDKIGQVGMSAKREKDGGKTGLTLGTATSHHRWKLPLKEGECSFLKFNN